MVSRRFDSIVTPIKYEYLRLNDDIIDERSRFHFPHAVSRIHAHTRHVEVSSDLDPRGIKRFLEQVHNLISVRSVTVLCMVVDEPTHASTSATEVNADLTHPA